MVTPPLQTTSWPPEEVGIATPPLGHWLPGANVREGDLVPTAAKQQSQATEEHPPAPSTHASRHPLLPPTDHAPLRRAHGTIHSPSARTAVPSAPAKRTRYAPFDATRWPAPS